MTVSERTDALRARMAQCGVDAYVVPSSDSHQSEYVGDSFKAREYITGFTGSVGAAVITAGDAALWVDGRYYIQAEHQLAGSGVRMMKMGEDGVPSITWYLRGAVKSGGKLGFYGRTMGYEEGAGYASVCAEKGASLEFARDLVGEVWTDRPGVKSAPVFELEEAYSGEARAAKLARVRAKMEGFGASRHVLATLDDIAWLLNLRGDEPDNRPLFAAYMVLDASSAVLYADEAKFGAQIRDGLRRDGVTIAPYDAVYADIAAIAEGETLLIDPDRVNYALAAGAACKLVKHANPTVMFKACKNETELRNIRAAHIKDGVAQTRFMRWIKTHAGLPGVDEISAGEKLRELRAEQEGFMYPSFGSIVAYMEHAAIIHYRAEPETAKVILAEQMLLTDSGGNYLEGSTDITRTYALGEVCLEHKAHYTAVLRGLIALSRLKFRSGAGGFAIDVAARQPLWEAGLDYNHGTGHGVGYLTTIHEAPCNIRWQIPAGKPVPPALAEGMVLTNEPGVYVEGSHGIRLENELVVRKAEQTAFGQFLRFETITFSPFDTDAILPEQLTEGERAFLNDYHRQVFELISPHLDSSEQDWLREYTRPI